MKGSIPHTISFLNSLSFKKVFNFLVNRGSYCYSSLAGNPIHLGKPVSISIEPTTSCNLSCTHCPSGLKQFTRPTGSIQPEISEKILEELSPWLLNVFFYFQGEPFHSKNVFNLIKQAKERNVYTALSTNGHYLDEENCLKIVDSGLDKIIISLDGLDPETYKKYRAEGDYMQVIKGIQQLVKVKEQKKKSHPFIELQFLVFSHNEHQINDFHKLGNYLGVNSSRLKTAQIYDVDTHANLIPKKEKYARYKQNADGSYVVKSRLLNRCKRMWESAVITWDGKILPCCFDKDGEFTMGDIITKPFLSVWNGSDYNNFRKRIFTQRKEVSICRNCTEK